MQKKYDSLRDMAEKELERLFTSDMPQRKLLKSMRYSLLAGGKRLRPVLTLEFCRISGGHIEKALPVAAAIEMIHTYTLIHDDLPCMDDDDLRRGRPTNHKVYGEAVATLAGDALHAAAFKSVLGADIGDSAARRAAIVLAEAASETGVCGGQILDLEGETRDLTAEEIINVYTLKTSALIKAAAVMGAVSGGADDRQIEAAGIFGKALGLAFQIKDDMLNESSTEAELGKAVGSDRARGKSTLLSLYGQNRCGELIREKTKIALRAVDTAFEDTDFLKWMSIWLLTRKN